MATVAAPPAVPPPGYVANATDCDDGHATVYPGASEICDGLDNDCDSAIDEGLSVSWYQDADKDGYGNPSVAASACSQPSGYASNNTDCNDSTSQTTRCVANSCVL